MQTSGKNIALLLLGLLLAPQVSLDSWAQHHGNEPPPARVGDRSVTVSLNLDHILENGEYLGRLRLLDVNADQTILHVTYFVTVSKDGKALFSEWFHDHEGDLPFKIRPKETSKINVYGEKEPTMNGYMKRGQNPVLIEGPLFMTNGVYDFNIEIISIDNDKTLLNEPLRYQIHVPIGAKAGMQLHGSKTVAGMHVELLTDQVQFEPNIPAKFWISISDAQSGKLLEKVSHAFVISSGERELLREYHELASYEHEYIFTEDQIGSISITIENLNDSGENIDFAATVVPEFPFGALFVIPALVVSMIAISRIAKTRNLAT